MFYALNPSLVPDALVSIFASISNTHLAISSDGTLSREAFFALNQPGAKVRSNEGNISFGRERTDRTQDVQRE